MQQNLPVAIRSVFKTLSKSVIVIFCRDIEKSRHKIKLFRSRITIKKEEIFYQNTSAQKFNEFFVNIGTNLANKNSKSKNTRLEFGSELTSERLEKALANLKHNKRPGWDSISSNVVKDISNEISCF